MEVGRHSYGREHIQLFWESGHILKIGAFCSIANNCKIYMGGSHNVHKVTTYPFGHRLQSLYTNYSPSGHPVSKGPVVIGNDVWIAGNVTIMPGVTIGDGAVIAHNSHVVKDIEPYTMVGGNPARLIRHRFSPEQIARLLRVKWWNWPDEKINTLLPLLTGTDIDAFLDAAEKSV